MSNPDNYNTKWYYDFPSHSGSLPWVRVDEFRTFLIANYGTGGRGPTGVTLSSRCGLQPGDVTQLYLPSSGWFHAVIIVVKMDSSCLESSFLYDSHTTDRFHYPLSYLAGYTKRYIGIIRLYPK
jgi:putative amidase-like protein